MASLTKHRCGRLKAAKETNRTTSNATSTNTFGYMTPPDTGDINALRGYQFQHNPAIPYTYANARNKLFESYQNPMGGYTNPQIRDAQLRSGNRALAQDESQALREENFGLQNLKYGQLASLAQLTSPRLVQTGGTQSGTAIGSEPIMNSIVSGAAGMGSALLL